MLDKIGEARRQHLLDVLKNYKLTQAALGAELEISPRQLRRYTSGEAVVPYVVILALKPVTLALDMERSIVS